MLSRSFNAIRKMVLMLHEQEIRIMQNTRSKETTDDFQNRRKKSAVPSYSQYFKEKAVTWSQSFEALLRDKYGVSIFKEFLRSEFSEENLEFWTACEDFKKCNDKEIERQAQKIYRTFVALYSSKRINLDSETLALTESNLERPSRSTFDPAQKRIQALMQNDSYPRFLESPVYKFLISDEGIM